MSGNLDAYLIGMVCGALFGLLALTWVLSPLRSLSHWVYLANCEDCGDIHHRESFNSIAARERWAHSHHAETGHRFYCYHETVQNPSGDA